jgi:membrane-bound lytic murein transglycosylase B
LCGPESRPRTHSVSTRRRRDRGTEIPAPISKTKGIRMTACATTERDLRRPPGSINHSLSLSSSDAGSPVPYRNGDGFRGKEEGVGLRRLAALAATIVLLAVARPAAAAEVDFATWLGGVRQEALSRGIRPATLDRALKGLQPSPRVLELDRRQPERTLTYAEYLDRAINQARIAAARQHLAENRKVLEEVGRKYGVQPRFIVALWGLESDFGHMMGNFPVVQALATLAYDGRRSAFFRGELMAALKILDRGDITPEAMLGSWAGAMGQSQFMPSSFLSYAVDWDGDGRRDIWHRREDVFASIANYLSRVGWHGDQGWGREVRLPPGFDKALIGIDTRKKLGEWQRLGVRRADGGELQGREIDGSLVQPGGAGGPTLIVYDNYRTVMKWNNSLFFASAVGYLADSMEER